MNVVGVEFAWIDLLWAFHFILYKTFGKIKPPRGRFALMSAQNQNLHSGPSSIHSIPKPFREAPAALDSSETSYLERHNVSNRGCVLGTSSRSLEERPCKHATSQWFPDSFRTSGPGLLASSEILRISTSNGKAKISK